MLCDLPTLKTYLRIASSDMSQDALLNGLLPVADGIVKRFCKRDLETAYYTNQNAEYRDGNGYRDLWLYQRPVVVSPPGVTGNLTAGSPVITGLSLNAQAYLSVGQPVQTTGTAPQGALGAFPAGATISSVDSASAVTCSAAATKGGQAVPLVFGIRVYLNPAGFGGDGVGGFGSTAVTSMELFLGINYALKRDTDGGNSKAALITRLGGGFIGSTISGAWPTDWPSGFLSARLGPYWPRGIQNVKIEYAAGLGVGAIPGGSLPPGTTIPFELTLAVAKVVSFMRVIAPAGVPVDAEATGRQALMALSGKGELDPEIGTARNDLNFYREFAF